MINYNVRHMVKNPDLELDPAADSSGESYCPWKRSTSGRFNAWKQRTETPGEEDIDSKELQAGKEHRKFWKLSGSQDSDSDTGAR